MAAQHRMALAAPEPISFDEVRAATEKGGAEFRRSAEVFASSRPISSARDWLHEIKYNGYSIGCAWSAMATG